MMRRVFIWLAMFGCGIFVGVWYSGKAPMRECPELIATLELIGPNEVRYPVTRLGTIVSTNADGTVTRYRVGDPSNPNCNLTLNGSEPLVIPDHHGVTTVRVVDIKGNKATIVYLSEFNHSSFGQNVRTFDCRVAEIDLVEIVRQDR